MTYIALTCLTTVACRAYLKISLLSASELNQLLVGTQPSSETENYEWSRGEKPIERDLERGEKKNGPLKIIFCRQKYDTIRETKLLERQNHGRDTGETKP